MAFCGIAQYQQQDKVERRQLAESAFAGQAQN